MLDELGNRLTILEARLIDHIEVYFAAIFIFDSDDQIHDCDAVDLVLVIRFRSAILSSS